MTVKKVFRDVPADDLFVGFQSVGEPLAHPGSDFKTDMQQLPEVRIIMRRRLHVAQRVGVLSGTPAHDRFGIRQSVRVNVDHRAIRGGQFRKMFVRLGIHFFNERQPFAARLSQSDHLFKPSGARRFDVQPAVMFFDQPVDNGVNGEFVAPGMHAELEGVSQAEFADGEGDDAEVFIELFLELRKVPYVIDPFVKPPGEFRGNGLDRDAFPWIMARMRNSSTGFCGASVSSTETSVIKLSRPFLSSIWR